MKILRILGLCSLALTTVFGQTNIQRDNKTHNINVDFNIGSGKTITFLSGAAETFNSGSTLTINGIFQGTPTGGVLNLQHVTVQNLSGGTGVTDGDKGDITISGAGTTYTINMATKLAFPIPTVVQTALDLKAGLTANHFSGIQTYDAATLYTPATIPALAINVAKGSNKKTISADTTFTFSGTPTAGTYFPLEVYNSDSSSHVMTIPSSFSTNHQAAITTFTILAGGRECLQFYYDGSIYQVGGVPTAGYSSEVTIASGTTTDIGAAESVNVAISGTTTITGFGSAAAGTFRQGRFTGALILTHSSTLLLNNAGSNITTAANDRFAAYSPVSGTWVVTIFRADGSAIAGGGTGAPTVNAQTGTSYTFAIGDANNIVTMSNASPNTATIPLNASVAFLTGTVIVVGQVGSGTTTIAVTSGATINGSASSLVFNGQYQWMNLVNLGTNTWASYGGDFVTASGAASFTNKTFDASDTGNTIKIKDYIYLQYPHVFEGTNATQNTTATLITNGHATFSNSVDQATNYVEYYFQVPEDIDTSVTLRARLKILLGGTDTATHRYVLSSVSVADSAVPTSASLANAINIDFAGDASGASGDVETSAWTSLTGWAAALTPGQTWRIRLARDGDASEDGSSVNSTELGLVIEYGKTQ